MRRNSALIKKGKRIERGLPRNYSSEDLTNFTDRVYSTYDSHLNFAEAARVSSDSIIYKGFALERDSLYSPAYHSYYQTRHLAKNLLFGKKISLNRSTNYLLVTDQESHGHYHWLTEVLPRLWLLRERSSDFVLLLPDSPYIRTIGLESLDMLGFEFEDIVWMHGDEFLKVPNLFYVTKLARTGNLDDEIMQDLRRAFIGASQRRSRKLYISRASASRRKILNNDEVIAMLRAHGFEVFCGNDMSLAEQVQLFSECAVVIGIHGAGLTNCLFMHPGIMVELKRNEPTIAYWHLAGALEHEYYYYNGVPDSDKSLIGTGCNLTIPVKDFEKRILSKI